MPPTAKGKKAKKAGRDKQRRRGVLDLPKGIEERVAEGQVQRDKVPLEAHGEWATPDDRPDPVGIIEKQNAELARRVKKGEIESAGKALAKAQTRTSLRSLSKYAERVEGGYRIKQQPPVIVRPPETMSDDFEQVISQGLADYASSLGPDRRVVLDHHHYAGDSEYEHQGERVVHGQRLMQAASDAFLGWVTGTGEHEQEFYVRQLRDMKASAEVETMPPARLAIYAELCGATLARAHARTGDAAKITGCLGDDDKFERALERFAVAYADQTDADHAAFTEAAEEYRIEVVRGV